MSTYLLRNNERKGKEFNISLGYDCSISNVIIMWLWNNKIRVRLNYLEPVNRTYKRESYPINEAKHEMIRIL